MPQKSSIILNIHGLGEPPRPFEEGEEQYWLAPETFGRVLDRAATDPRCTVTFDDGNSSDCEIALPMLLQRGIQAQFFVLAGKVGKPGYLSVQQMQEMLQQGMQIGLHGMHHRPWPECNDSELGGEIQQAKDMLEQWLQKPITSAACPFGCYDRRVLGRLREAKFTAVYTSDGGFSNPQQWLQTRNTLTSGQNLTLVEDLLVQSPIGPSEWIRRGKTFVKSRR